MSILINSQSSVIVQGMTGKAGSYHTRDCLKHGTKIVAGVVPGRGGEQFDAVPVFNNIEQAKKASAIDVSLVFVPAGRAKEAVIEAVEGEIPLVVVITEGIPIHDMLEITAVLHGSSTRLIGPNCPGIITPGECKAGIMPWSIHRPGAVGVISRSGTLTYEAVHQMTLAGVGQSTCLGIGGDPVTGMSYIDCLRLFEADPGTKAVLLIGEIGGTAEEEAAEWIRKNMKKPVFCYIAGVSAPANRKLGHAGAICSDSRATLQKIETLKSAGLTNIPSVSLIGSIIGSALV